MTNYDAKSVTDAAAHLKKAGLSKLDVDFQKYTILGACNPPLAHRALQAEQEVGILLPCNVIVYETEDGGSIVSAMAPLSALGIAGDNPNLAKVAEEANELLTKAMTELEAA